jgi:hypothetical protein
VEGPSPWYETCNLAISRSVLEQIDGFDEAFVALGEDTDLGLRAEAAGAEHRYAEAALAYHAVLPRMLPGAIRDGWSRWETTPLVYRRHPGHRRHLFARFFFNRSHAELALLVAGLFAVRRSPLLAAAAAVPYAIDGFHFEDASPRRIARHAVGLPSRLLADAALAAGFVRGGLRHRAPLI